MLKGLGRERRRHKRKLAQSIDAMKPNVLYSITVGDKTTTLLGKDWQEIKKVGRNPVIADGEA